MSVCAYCAEHALELLQLTKLLCYLAVLIRSLSVKLTLLEDRVTITNSYDECPLVH